MKSKKQTNKKRKTPVRVKALPKVKRGRRSALGGPGEGVRLRMPRRR